MYNTIKTVAKTQSMCDMTPKTWNSGVRVDTHC
jgi:hypothetical protein